MGGIRGKSARKRAKMAENSKTFDRITGRFYDEKVAMPSGKVSQGDMLSAPKSFRRFLAAKAAAEARGRRRAGEEETDEETDEPPADGEKVSKLQNVPSKGGDETAENKDASSGDDEPDSKHIEHSEIKPLVRAQPDKGDERLKEKDERAAADAIAAETGKKKKYLSLRERKKRERALIRAEREEEERFLRGTGVEARFGEVAEAPPTITLKRKSGGKGEKAVPIAESGHKIVEIAENESGGKFNRQSKIFEELMSAAKGTTKTKKKHQTQGLKQQAEMAQLRAQVIADYRSMKGRPMHNGRNIKLAANPSKLFAGASLQGVSGATLRKDRR